MSPPTGIPVSFLWASPYWLSSMCFSASQVVVTNNDPAKICAFDHCLVGLYEAVSWTRIPEACTG
jgi:hypothetical protein